MLRKVKPKTAAGKRALEKREPQVYEEVKSCLFMKSSNASEIANLALKDLYFLKKPNSILYSKKNDLNVWEDPRPLDFFSEKTQASFIAISSSTKKRPHALTFARMYDHQVLDMIQLEIQGIKLMEQFKNIKSATGHYPIITFQGESWEISQELNTFKSIMQDLFRGPSHAKSISLSGIEHAISFTAISDKIHMRVYTIKLLKNDDMPKVELEEMGPRLDFIIKRVKIADSHVMKQATKVPKEIKPKKEKNVEFDAVGHEYGRIHMEKQDFNKLETRKMKGLKRKANWLISRKRFHVKISLVMKKMIPLLFALLGLVSAMIEHAAFEKLFLIVLENERLGHVLNDSYMGRKLVSQGRLLTDYKAVAHPSQPNYIAMISGSHFGIWNDLYHDLNAPTIVDLLEEKGLSWKTYQEDYPGGCFVGTTYKRYVRKHNPFISFMNISTNPDRCSQIVNSDELEADIYHNRTANFVMYVPDMDNNGHDTNYTYASNWLESFMQDVAYHPNMQSTLFMITFDEDDFFPKLWKRKWPYRWPDNHVYTLLLGKGITPGSMDDTPYNHYSILATLQEQWGLSSLGTHDVGATPFRYLGSN